MTQEKPITILGVFVADTAYRANRAPKMGETILGNSFALGPGGKGSNQAVAAARLGANVHFISKLGEDAFGDLALKTWHGAGVTPVVVRDRDSYTGAAYIFIEEATGDNAIIVCPGAAMSITPEQVNANRSLIQSSSVFMTQLEQPIDAATRALELANEANVATILNPAPAATLDEGIFPLCTYVTPNETEAADLTGRIVNNIDDARHAADRFLQKGVTAAVITLGEKGALYHDKHQSTHVPAYSAGTVVETTGAGDAFNGGFATALSQGMDPVSAAQFGCATAAISVTRPGTSNSMPSLDEVQALIG